MPPMRRVDVAIGVVRRGNQILICQRRSDDRFGGLWEFPGGKCHAGEEPQACLARELMEELAIEARIVRKLAVIHHDYPDLRVALHPFLCECDGKEPKPIASQQLKWVEAGEMTALRFPPANGALLKELSRDLGGGA